MWGPGTCRVKAVPVKAHYVDPRRSDDSSDGERGGSGGAGSCGLDQFGPLWCQSLPSGGSRVLFLCKRRNRPGRGKSFTRWPVVIVLIARWSRAREMSRLTPAGADQDCDIQAWYAGNDNYNSSPKVTIATIAIEAGTLDTPTWGAFSGSLTVGGGSSNPFRNEPGRGDGGLYPQVQFRGQLPLAQYQHRTGGGEGGGKSRREDVHGGGEGQ